VTTSARVDAGRLDDLDLYVDLYRRMLLIRGFEDLVQSLFVRSEIYGTTHLYSGQEAVAAGFASVLDERDRVAATYRGHGHALALGVDPQKLLDEMLGRATGINGGLAGSMNVTSPEDRLIGCFGIVGGSIAAATGAALALRDRGGVAVAYFGDGAMNQGYFFECLNFCQVLKLPAVLVCENNGYGEYTAFESVTAGALRARAEVMEVPAETIDGMSVWTVRDAARRATEHARSGAGPVFVEAITYRFVGHSRSDPGKYRPEGELDRWRERDPLLLLRARLEEEGADAAKLDETEASVEQQLAEHEERGLQAPFPEPQAFSEFKPNVRAAPAQASAAAENTVNFRTAIREALDQALAADERVIFFGEDVAAAGGVFAVTPGLYEKYGPTRVFDTPISELALAGAAFGSAVTGLRPVVEIMFGDFLTLAMDSIVNQMSKYWFLTRGQVSVPVVIRSVVGAGGRFGAIHSQMPVSWLMGIPGIKIVAPATPADAKGLLRAAIDDDNPVLFFEHKRLYGLEGAVDGEAVPIGKAAVVRQGRDVTIVSAMHGVHESLAAAESLAESGIEAEVIDLRTLRPFDRATVLESPEKTNRIVVVEEGPLTGGWAGEVLSVVTEQGLGDLDDAWRIATPDNPIPYSPPLEDAHVPGAERIAAEIGTRLGR
jgi:2-oxoisovalerate dehydrogenase E1 component